MDQAVTKFQKVIDSLRQQGWDDEKIAQFTDELSEAAFNKFYADAVTVLTPEDLDAIEASKDEDESAAKIKELYKLRTGRDADQEATDFFELFAEGFLNDLNDSQT